VLYVRSFTKLKTRPRTTSQ